jgi:hypothetical protein
LSGGGPVRATIDHCQFGDNGTSRIGASGDGINLQSGFPNPAGFSEGAQVNVRDSVATGNWGAGFRLNEFDLSLDHCESSNNNAYGVFACGGTATVSNSLVTNNKLVGFVQCGDGVFHSLRNNVVRRNGQNTSGTITVISGT